MLVTQWNDSSGAALAEAPDAVSGPAPVDRAVTAGTALVSTLVEALRTSRLTVLIGAAGSGKTGLLHEAVLPLLRRRSDDRVARPVPAVDSPAGEGVDLLERRRRRERAREIVVWCDRWDGSPTDRLHDCLDAAAGVPFAEEAGLSRAPVALRAAALGTERGARVLFVFDHGDRLEPGSVGRPGPGAEYDTLVDALCDAGPAVHLLVSVRDDALAPSLQARIERQGARVLRLPDRREPHPVTQPVAAAPDGATPEADAERPLQREEVYESIISRLAEIGDGMRETPWGGGEAAPASAAARTHEGGATATVAPRHVPLVSARWAGKVTALTRSGGAPRSANGRLAGIGLIAAAAVGVLLWQDRSHPVQRPAPVWADAAARRDAAIDSPPSPSTTPVLPPAAVDRFDLPAPEAAVVATVAPATSDPAAPVSASPVPAAPDAPSLVGASEPPPAAEPASEARLEGDLWRGLAAHGFPLPHGPTDADPVQALSSGASLAVVPYDTLRTLAAAPATAGSTRVVAPLFTEALQVIVRADSPLHFIHEIAGRRVDVGPAGSRRNRTASAFYRQLFDTPLPPNRTDTEGLTRALADLRRGGVLDAIVLPEAQPSAWLAGLPEAERRGLRLLRLAPDAASTRRAMRTYLPATLHVGTATAPQDVPTLAVMNFLVTRAPGRADGASPVAQALCQTLPALRRDGHPAWRDVDPTLRLPVPLAYDAGAAAGIDACAAARPSNSSSTSISISQADTTSRGDHQ